MNSIIIVLELKKLNDNGFHKYLDCTTNHPFIKTEFVDKKIIFKLDNKYGHYELISSL